MATPVDALIAMSIRGRAALKKAGLGTLEAAAERPDEELLGLEGFGDSSLGRLRAWQRGEMPTVMAAARQTEREKRIWELYRGFLTAGVNKDAAYAKAVEGVDSLAEKMEEVKS